MYSKATQEEKERQRRSGKREKEIRKKLYRRKAS
jgi:hypothetical protein